MEKQKIDLTKVVHIVLNNWKLFLIATGGAFLVGVIIAFSIPKLYTSDVVLAPESSDNSIEGNMSSLASMVGVHLGSATSSDAFYPRIYPEIFSSNDFVIPLWDMKIKTADGAINTTLYNYLARYQKIPWWRYGQVYATRFIRMLKGKPQGHGVPQKTNKFQLTEEEDAIASGIKGMMKCEVDQKTDVISISVSAQDPLVAATVADSVMTALQNYITIYRTNKARNDLNYMKKLFGEAKRQYEEARRAYGSFADANTDLLLQSYKLKSEDLENDMQLKYNTYSQLSQQVQAAYAKVQERTPAFTVMQSATVPLRKSKPSRMLIIFAFMMIGFLGTLGYITQKPKISKATR